MSLRSLLIIILVYFLKSLILFTCEQLNVFEFFGFFAGTVYDVHFVIFARRTYDI